MEIQAEANKYPKPETGLTAYGVGPADGVTTLQINIANDPLRAVSLDEFYSRAYAAAKDLGVEVEGDPVKRGLFTFHTKTSALRQYQNFVVRMIFVGIKIRTKTHSQFLYGKEIYEQEVRKGMLKISDYEDAGYGGKKVRVSIDTKRMRAELDLEESRKCLHLLEDKYQEAKAFVEAMSLIRDNLKSTRDDLLFSMTTIRSQMLTGEVPILNTNLSRGLEKSVLKMNKEENEKSFVGGDVEL